MIENYLIAIAWICDPAFVGKPSMAIATCARPAAGVVQAQQTFAMTSDTFSVTTSPNCWLTHWQNATRFNPERSRSEQEEFRRCAHESLNEHTLAAVELFIGQIQAKKLDELFHWRILHSHFDIVCLEATPRDETEQLFYGALQISLNVNSGCLEKLVVVGRNQVERTVWKTDRLQTANRIELVHFENDVPPSPDSVIRMANSRVE